MAFIIYLKEMHDDNCVLKNTGIHYKLAGWNLIYNLWLKKEKPVNKGWYITDGEILSEIDSEYNSDNTALIIDFHPNSSNRIGLVLIKDIFVYTYGEIYNGDITAYWSPLMLKLKDVLYEEGFDNLTPERKGNIVNEILWEEPEEIIIEFLYLNGDDKSWNWGKNGMTNAVFLHEATMKYFKQFI